MEKEKDGFLVIIPENESDWRNWLEKNHQKVSAVWLVLFKKSSPSFNLDVDSTIDQALCFGWIDSKPNKRDAESFTFSFHSENPKAIGVR
jgi:uncharacterized protein YdeI (YjbR/CyaY-like superfamily)